MSKMRTAKTANEQKKPGTKMRAGSKEEVTGSSAKKRNGFKVKIGGLASKLKRADKSGKEIKTGEGKTASKKWSKKKVGAIVGAAVGLIVLVVLGCVLVPEIFGTKYGETYSLARELKGDLDDLYADSMSKCQEVREDLFDTDVDQKDFEKMLGKCQDELTETREKMVELGESPGVKKDDELRTKYDKALKTLEKSVPAEDEVEREVEVLRTVHEFVTETRDYSYSELTESQVSRAAKILTKSGDEELEDFGEDFEYYANKVVQAYAKYQQTYSSGTLNEFIVAIREKNNAVSALEDCIREWGEDLLENTAIIDVDNGDSIVSDFGKFYSVTKEAYEKHYDGQNTDVCQKKNKEVKCK